MDEFRRYCELRERGDGATTVYVQGKADGLDFVGSIRMLRAVFDVSLVEAKEIVLVAETEFETLAGYQESLIPAIKAALERPEDE